MSKKKECDKVVHRAPRFRQDTQFMRAHETMVDLIKGNVTGVMDILGAGIFGFLQNLELDEERDLYYSDDEGSNFNEQSETQELKPHPRIKELDDKEAAKQIKESIEEEEKRKSKSVKNKRKKMRKKEKKRQEREEGDKKVLPEEEQKKALSESEEEEENNWKEIENSISDLPDELQNIENTNAIIEEKPVQLNKEQEDPPENLDSEKSPPCITESVAATKTKNKSEKNESTPTTDNKKIEEDNIHKPKEEPKEEKSLKTEEENVSEFQKKEQQDESKNETVELVDEYAKKSREMAAIGNRLAANGQYEMAIKCFTEAIKATPKEYKLFGNRSFCFEKMQQFEEALSDAEISLALEPTWTKGLFRKGKALSGLKKYYEASVAFSEVLKIESTSQEAIMELKRAQTLHLMEMGFTWAQCTNALKRHATLEEAIDALFTEELQSSLQENGACKLDQSTADQRSVEEWEKVRLSTKPKPQNNDKVEPLCPPSKKQAKPGQLFPVWVGSLSPTVNYVTLHEVFNRVGKVFSIKMVLEHQCAFVNYTTKVDCERAIEVLNGFLLEGRPLSVRYPSRLPPGLGASKHAVTDPNTPPCIQKECFFWRTIGCTKDDCTYKHIPQNKGIDQEKFSVKGNSFF